MAGTFRILNYGIQGFRRNIWLSLIAVITMTLTIVTISVFALGNVAAVQQYKEFNRKLDYIIFIRDEASDTDVANLRQQVTNRSEVTEVKYLDKQAVFEEFEADPMLTDATKASVTADHNPLAREIEVKFADPHQYQDFDAFVKQDRFKQVVESESYSQDNKKAVDNYLQLTNFLRIFGLTFTAFFILIAIIIILNTIRLTIFSRREEIEVMRLVGATRGFIRGPFLVEGVLFGVIGALIASVLIWTFLYQLQSLLNLGLGSSNPITQAFQVGLGYITDQHKFNGLFSQLFLLQFLVGIGLGTICSALAIRRYLRE